MDLDRLSAGLSESWRCLVRDWDRCLRSTGRPETTRYNYLLAVVQLGKFVVANGGGDASEDPAAVSRADVESFQAWMIETRSASTALNKHKCLQQFFQWLAEDEQAVDRSPVDGVRPPQPPTKLIPVISTDDTTRLLESCKGSGFMNLRDQAMIRLYCNTGARLSEVANLRVDDIDWSTDSLVYHGKGGKTRRVRMGPKTARALSRYLRVRARHTGSELPELWLAERGGVPLRANGIKLRLRRLGDRAGIARVHAHRWRHNYAHEWKRSGGDTGDLMLLLGWSSDAMARHYGASAAAERAQETQSRMRIGDDV
ncbi:tyrosine-type recombinase/integrase [Saccharopolyspora sp. ID03-671]|uniref:tyrosine-type recombinase/integrase n=1 Tax=Saccharopolyspora sp. ID03-671 TaxID=3073066 RepID=UPI00325505F8